MRMSLENFQHQQLDMRTELNSVREEADSSIGIPTAITRSANRKERMDPSQMMPAGMKSWKTKSFNNKYAAH